ncbi:MAG: hypothetical protein IJK52_08705 [Oscillospiraceae bacterium]|nr:hypothetical protein [Oscillospiraceae bacterium]
MKIDKFCKEAYKQTLSKLSENPNYDKGKGRSLIQDDTHYAYNLDGITKRVCEELRLHQRVASCDAYLPPKKEKKGKLVGCSAYLNANETHWFIEFRDEAAVDIDEQDIWKKAYDSVSTVRMAIDQTITLDDLCQNSDFLVVYQDEEPKTEDAVEKGTAGLAEMEHIRWGLRKIVGKLYRKVHTIPATEFRQKWIPRIWGGEI